MALRGTGARLRAQALRSRADNRLAPDEYKALHPMGIAPVITDGDLVLGESGAICDYICGRYGDGRLRPAPDDRRFRRPPVLVPLVQRDLHDHADDAAGAGRRRPTDNPAAAFVGDRSRRGWAMVEARLGEAPFFGGANLTTADIMMVYCLTTGRAFRGMSIEAYPNLKAYLAAHRPAPRVPARHGQGRAGHDADAQLIALVFATAIGVMAAGGTADGRDAAAARGNAIRPQDAIAQLISPFGRERRASAPGRGNGGNVPILLAHSLGVRLTKPSLYMASRYKAAPAGPP